MSIVRLPLFILSVLAALALGSCDSTPTGPGTGSGSGSGNLLRATINGTTHTFVLSEQRYDSQIHYSFVSGISGTAKTLTITFTSDLNSGTYPRTLARDVVNIIYIEQIGGENVIYDCLSNNDERTMTLTRNSGGIVDGTFSGTPSVQTDATKRVTITGGDFSVDPQ